MALLAGIGEHRKDDTLQNVVISLTVHNKIEPFWINYVVILQSVELCEIPKSKAVIL